MDIISLSVAGLMIQQLLIAPGSAAISDLAGSLAHSRVRQ
jgi:hypothetical protein